MAERDDLADIDEQGPWERDDEEAAKLGDDEPRTGGDDPAQDA